MTLSGKSRFILFTLFWYLNELNMHLKTSLLEVSISKSAFIKALKKAMVVKKTERSLYKNLENLEKQRYIAYDNKTLALTRKGLDAAQKMHKDMEPYYTLMTQPKKEFQHIKLQTVFR
jgi:DNA-binding PadR family transcriptional regulator